MTACPQCGSRKGWYFSRGQMADSVFDRFDKVEPDTGYCSKCGFSYSEHIRHSLEEQIHTFRQVKGLTNEKEPKEPTHD